MRTDDNWREDTPLAVLADSEGKVASTMVVGASGMSSVLGAGPPATISPH